MRVGRFTAQASSLLRRYLAGTAWLLLVALSTNPVLAQGTPGKLPAAHARAETLSAGVSASPFHITGIVINSVTKAPIAGAELTATSMPDGGSGASASTSSRGRRRAARQTEGPGFTALSDTKGRFQVDLPSAGGWSFAAAARGYHTQALDEHGGYSTGVMLTDGAPVFEVVFPLPPACAVEGFVLDEAGEAVRGGQVALTLLPPPEPDNPHPKPQTRDQQMTDDRGYYQFGSTQPGAYEIRLQAQPWYAATAAGAFGMALGPESGATVASGTEQRGPDPLDVVYPTTWYPGVTDHGAATPILLRAGDTQEADFRLLPVAGFHLHVAPGTPVVNADGTREVRPSQMVTYVSQILPDGTETVIRTASRTDAEGNLDVSGLPPGEYQVHLQDGSASGNSTIAKLQLNANSARTVELSQAVEATPVSLTVDPNTDTQSLQVLFTNRDNGTVTYAGRRQGQPVQRDGAGQRGGLQRQRRDASNDAATEAGGPPVSQAGLSVSLQPGSYEVTLSGVRDLRLVSVESTGAKATGRTLSIGIAPAAIVLHVARGRGKVEGKALLEGKPDPGAMVLLVPAGLGDPSDLDITRRDQSNSDGSYEIAGVLPGKYILVAIDHGWDVNWADPQTLRRFLLHGVPLNITLATLTQGIEAQKP